MAIFGITFECLQRRNAFIKFVFLHPPNSEISLPFFQWHCISINILRELNLSFFILGHISFVQMFSHFNINMFHTRYAYILKAKSSVSAQYSLKSCKLYSLPVGILNQLKLNLVIEWLLLIGR